MTHETTSKQSQFVEFFAKNLWAIALVIASVIAQWAVFGVRLDTVEARQDRQGQAITSLQEQVQDADTRYAALEAKVDSLNENVLYIRNRIDKVFGQ